MSPEQSSEPPEQPTEPTEYSFDNPALRFLIGAVLSGVPMFAYLLLSVEMTGSWGTIAGSKLAIAIAIPLICGALAVFWGQRVIRFLSTLLESANLPF